MANFGEKLKTLRERYHFSQDELAKRAGVTTKAVYGWERMKDHGIRGANYRKLAEAFGLSTQELDLELQEPPDLNVEPYSEHTVPEIPTFDLPIAAGPWMELPETMELNNPQVLRDGRFRVHIRGDSMEKTYPDGSLVEFRILKWETPGAAGSKMEIGRDYYVQLAECATFKRLVAFDDDMLEFAALNKKKYPKKIKTLRSDVFRMARAEYILKKAG